MSIQTPPARPLIYLGHPGHELRIYGWLRLHRPQVWVITDGSGSQIKPRTELSRRLLQTIETQERGGAPERGGAS